MTSAQARWAKLRGVVKVSPERQLATLGVPGHPSAVEREQAPGEASASETKGIYDEIKPLPDANGQPSPHEACGVVGARDSTEVHEIVTPCESLAPPHEAATKGATMSVEGAAARGMEPAAGGDGSSMTMDERLSNQYKRCADRDHRESSSYSGSAVPAAVAPPIGAGRLPHTDHTSHPHLNYALALPVSPSLSYLTSPSCFNSLILIRGGRHEYCGHRRRYWLRAPFACVVPAARLARTVPWPAGVEFSSNWTAWSPDPMPL